jgi:hypothetical protein
MRSLSFYQFLFLFILPLFSLGQASEEMLFKPSRVASSQVETIEVVSIGQPSFAVSNMADGTVASFRHSLRVTYSLQTLNAKGSFQLIFFGENDQVPYSVNIENGNTFIYMPYLAHDHFKSKLDQALTVRKKAQLKISLLTTGAREAIWIF